MFDERRAEPRYTLLAQVGVSAGGKTYWGSVSNVSRSGVGITLRQTMKTNQKVTLRFLLHSDEGREVTESLTGRILWTHGDKAAVEKSGTDLFSLPESIDILVRSAIHSYTGENKSVPLSALLSAPCLAAFLAKKESGG